MMRYHAQSYFALLADDPGLAAAANPELSLYFDEHRLDFTLTETSLYFSCELLRLDERRFSAAGDRANVFMAILLEANCMGAGAGGAIFLLDEKNALCLRGQALLAGLDTAGLAALIEDFLEHIDYWRPQLAALLTGGGEPGAAATTHSAPDERGETDP